MEPKAGPSPEQLMTAYQGGDREAANRLIETLSPPLFRFFRLQTADRRHAEDLLQEVWLRIHKARHTYRPGDAVLPWLYAIARNVRVDGFRKRRFEEREKPLEAAPEPVCQERDEPRSMPDWEALFSHLPRSQREVLSLLKGSGLTLEEVARATATSVGAVKQKAHRAYMKLRSLLAEGTR
jgi:RNA polymerase sigma-70 factor (ECF subfamily)